MNKDIRSERVDASSSDYRHSHLAPEKGESYSAMFSHNPYRNMIWEFEKRILDRSLAAFLKNHELYHLDFACGTGRILAHFATRARVSVGIDVSPSMLSVARKNQCRSELFEADLTKNDILGNRKFNLITAFRFFPNAQPSLREDAMRVLIKHLDEDGWLVFNNHNNFASIKYRLARLRGRGGFKGMSLTEVHDLLATNGLKIDKKYSLGFTPANEEHTFIPIFLLRRVEGILSKCPILKDLGENLVFVCRRND
jgi:SAM-dependent methyltransferase